MAIRAVGIDAAGVALGVALTCHLHDAERGNREDVVLCLVVGHFAAHARQHGVAILLGLHIDEVEDDESADVAQAHLAADLGRRF